MNRVAGSVRSRTSRRLYEHIKFRAISAPECPARSEPAYRQRRSSFHGFHLGSVIAARNAAENTGDLHQFVQCWRLFSSFLSLLFFFLFLRIVGKPGPPASPQEGNSQSPASVSSGENCLVGARARRASRASESPARRVRLHELAARHRSKTASRQLTRSARRPIPSGFTPTNFPPANSTRVSSASLGHRVSSQQRDRRN